MPTKRKKKSARRVAAPAKKQPAKILFHVEGKMSTFGGPNDHGMSPSEGLALFEPHDLDDPKYADLFLPAPPPGTSGLGRRLNPDKYYFACRWNYNETSRELLRRSLARVENPQSGLTADARPVDWGPNEDTSRAADLSPGLAAALKLNTDDFVSITIAAERAVATGKKKGAIVKRAGHGSSNPNLKPPIKEFIESPFHSARNGGKIDKVVLHCTESSLPSTLREFQTGARQVSAHYVIDRNGDIYQMVRDSERANHCMGANENSIGIEHVGGETEPLAPAQAKASASLVRWLIAQYDIPRTSVFGHDFTPGYSRPGGTSCPDKLFGAAHSQATIAAWVEANV